MGIKLINENGLSSVADAIRAKTGTSEALEWPQGYIDAVEAIPTGGGGGSTSVPAKEVNFRDYDGTIVYSYTPAEFTALEAMPANPDHSGDEIPLTAQGWNWSLNDAKTYVAKYGRLEVGQMYITTDGKTHIKIYIDQNTPANCMDFPLYFSQSVSQGVRVNWGDGSIPETYYGTNLAQTHTHTYNAPGHYDITLDVTRGYIMFVGSSGNNGYSIYGSRENAYSYNRGRIRKIHFGDNVIIDNASSCAYVLYFCYTLTVLTIPHGVTAIRGYFAYHCDNLNTLILPDTVQTIGNSAFMNGSGMVHVSLPAGVTSIDENAFGNNYSLYNICLPDGLTSVTKSMLYNFRGMQYVALPPAITGIGETAFYNCQSLVKLIIPATVSSIGANAFQYCYGVSEYHLLSETPPTLENTNAFVSIQSGCVIYVPYSEDHSILNAYKSATNWSTRAAYMQEEPQ